MQTDFAPIRKTRSEIDGIRAAGQILARAHAEARRVCVAGATTADIDRAVTSVIEEHGATALFREAPGAVPFPAATCTSVNDEIVHGIPGERRLIDGDLVSVDIGVRLGDWCADGAVTHAIGEIDAPRRRLVETTRSALELAIDLVGRKRMWSEVAMEIEALALGAELSVIEELCGHGIGRQLWEPPQVPNCLVKGAPDFALRPGLVIAIEPMFNLGTRHIRLLPDQWTIATKDGLPSAHFEHTIALTEDGVEILTAV